jgi:phosphoserine phosphatase
MQADVVRPIPYGPGKIHQLEARIGKRPLLAAFGDNVFDVPMLEAARVAVAVDPKPRLLARLKEMPTFAPLLLRTRSS